MILRIFETSKHFLNYHITIIICLNGCTVNFKNSCNLKSVQQFFTKMGGPKKCYSTSLKIAKVSKNTFNLKNSLIFLSQDLWTRMSAHRIPLSSSNLFQLLVGRNKTNRLEQYGTQNFVRSFTAFCVPVPKRSLSRIVKFISNNVVLKSLVLSPALLPGNGNFCKWDWTRAVEFKIPGRDR